MPYSTPITDRDATDITDKTAKAFFNVVDWARIYGNAEIIKALVDFLLSIDIAFDAVAAPTITTIPTVTQLNTLLANIERIRVASCLPAITGMVAIPANWTSGSGADAPDYLDVNDWERVIDLIFNSMAASVEYTVYCGVSATGQPRFYQHRFRQFAGWVLPSVSPVRRARTGHAICGTDLTRTNGFRRYD